MCCVSLTLGFKCTVGIWAVWPDTSFPSSSQALKMTLNPEVYEEGAASYLFDLHLIFRSCHLCKKDCNKSVAGLQHYHLFRLDNWWLGGVMVLTYLHWHTKSTGWVSRRSCPWTGSWSSGSLLKQLSGDVPWIPALTEPASGLHQLNKSFIVVTPPSFLELLSTSYQN